MAFPAFASAARPNGTLSPRALGGAVLLHVVLLGVLLSGVRCQPKPELPQPIEAVLIDPAALAQAASARKARMAAEPVVEPPPPESTPQPVPEPPPPATEPPPRPAPPEPTPPGRPQPTPPVPTPALPDPAAARNAQLLAQQAEAMRLAALQQAQQIEATRRVAREQQDAEALDSLAKAAQQEEAERRQRQQRAEAEVREAALKDELSAEAQAREAAQAAASASARAAALSAWAIAVQRTIKSNYARPPSSLEDFTCRVEMNLAPSGAVISARIVDSCGSAATDDSVLRAVYKSDPLPTPSDPSVFQRTLRLTFRP